MKIIGLTIQHFLTIGDSVTLNLADRGLVLISGVNEDDTSATSNGAGKSTIADALCWALFGLTARDESGDAVVNHIRKKDCMVQVTLQDGDSIYQITRYRKHSLHKNALTLKLWNPSAAYTAGALPTDLTKGTERETQADVALILGSSHEVFSAAIYAGQEAMPDLPGMTDKQLKMMIEEAAGVERLERAYAIARAEEAVVANQLTAAELVKSTNETRLVSVKASLLDQQAKFQEFEAGRPARQSHWTSQMDGHANSIRFNHAELVKIDVPTLTAEAASLQGQLAGYNTAVAIKNGAQQKVSLAERNVFQWEAMVAGCGTKIKDVMAQVAHLTDHPEEGCVECGKPRTVMERHEAVMKYTEDLQTAKASATDTHRKLVLARNELVAANEALTAANAGIPDVTAAAGRSAEISKLLAQATAFRNAMTVEKGKYDTAKQYADATLTEPNPCAGGVELATKSVEQIRDAIWAADTDMVKHADILALKRDVTKVFAPAGVRAHILDTVTPFLNDRTAEYLNALSDGNISAVWSTLTTTAKGELREKFNIEVTNDKGGKSFKSISGGEKRKVRLACMLALQDLVAARATKPMDLWIGDEIDEALDDAGLERLMVILERKAREHGTVLIISHNPLKDWCDQEVTVTKRGGVSTIEGVLCV